MCQSHYIKEHIQYHCDVWPANKDIKHISFFSFFWKTTGKSYLHSWHCCCRSRLQVLPAKLSAEERLTGIGCVDNVWFPKTDRQMNALCGTDPKTLERHQFSLSKNRYENCICVCRKNKKKNRIYTLSWFGNRGKLSMPIQLGELKVRIYLLHLAFKVWLQLFSNSRSIYRLVDLSVQLSTVAFPIQFFTK